MVIIINNIIGTNNKLELKYNRSNQKDNLFFDKTDKFNTNMKRPILKKAQLTSIINKKRIIVAKTLV